MGEVFRAKLKDDRSSVNRLRTALSQRQYNVLMSKVLVTKLNKSHRSAQDLLLLEKYDVTNSEPKRLIVPSTNPTKPVFYVHDDELFQVFLSAHLSTDHGNRDKMMKLLKKQFKNVTYKDITIFLSVCQECITKKQEQPTEIDKRSAQFNNQCYVDFIDYEFSPDGSFKYILVYREMYTKFSILKPLNSTRPEEVATNLINIFGILGPPAFLQSSCGTKFVEKLIDILKILWPSLEIGNMKTEVTDSFVQDIESLVTSWMRCNKKSKWSEGIRFVQLKCNTIFNEEINMTPYEALFKHKVKVGSSRSKDDGDEENEEMAVVCKEETINDDDNENNDIDDGENVEMNEIMEISKTEPKTICGDCGTELSDEDVECNHCKSKELT
ncbi:hypothetical protein Zmor_026149 [Zophobas morio]|uniref:KRAB-A domain-containing protein 2-like n=1 Tax=Zophobas morio TaxID=2755281 RepID=A0AA38HT06_9CUCU|nr:hypothetical protein Zmor_026149 [Zophobas morio]